MDWVKYAKPGDKVVCVDNHADQMWASTAEMPQIGAIYTIDAIFDTEDGRIAFDLIEIRRDEIARKFFERRGLRGGYGSWRFRPLEKRKTDISIFTAMLDKVSEPA